MGCDIHAVVEYQRDGGLASGWAYPDIERDYDLFRALAFAEIADGIPMRYPPRGFPADFSIESQQRFMREGYIPASRAAMNVHEAEAVLGSDLHTPSWLSLAELIEVLGDFGLTLDKQPPTFQAAVAAMQALANRYGTGNVRLVYCFDG